MPILCLDTATITARVAVIGDGEGPGHSEPGAVLAAREATAARHSSNVLRLCDECLVQVGLRPAALSAIACGAGPGSFTGLRVGLAVAKGLALPTGVPLVLVSSLAAMAVDIFAATPDAADGALVVACLDAGKGEVHAGLFRRDPETLVAGVTAAVVTPPGLLASRVGAGSAPVTLAGSGADRYADVLDPALPAGWRRLPVAGPSAAAIGRLGRRQLLTGGGSDLERAVPDYGRGPDITVKKPRQK